MESPSVLSLALLILLVTIPSIVGMAWVAWLALGHSSRLAARGMSMAEEMQRHAWSSELSKSPERANAAVYMEGAARSALQPAVAPDWTDDLAMSR